MSTPSARTPENGGDLVLEQRFAIVPEWVIDAQVSDAAFRLYAVLLRYGQSSGARMPSRAVLAARLRKRSTDTVDRALKELVAVGAVAVERRRRGRENLTNRYYVMSTPPSARAAGTAEGGRIGAATSTGFAGGRTGRGRGSRTGAVTLAAGARPDPEVPTQEHPLPASPLGVDVEELAGRCREVRRAVGLPVAGWTSRAVAAAMTHAVVEADRPVVAAVRALLVLAADPTTRAPGRLAWDGPWWTGSAGFAAGDPAVDAELAVLEARLAEADGRRVWLQRRARQELASRGEPVTRLTVAREACRLLDGAAGEVAS